MKPRLKVSKSGLEFIKRFEGLRRSAARLADGRWTVGYSHLKFAREGAELTEKDAEALLIYDLIEVMEAVNDKTFVPLSQNQFDALVSFAFNVGAEKFARSNVLRRVIEGDHARAAFALESWRRAPFDGQAIVIDALIRRRAAEKSLYLTPDQGFAPAPSSVLLPELDYEVESHPPVSEPVQLTIPLDGGIAEAFREPATSVEPVPTAPEAAVAAVTEQLQTLAPDPVEPERVVAPEAEIAAAEETAPDVAPADEAIEPFPAIAPTAPSQFEPEAPAKTVAAENPGVRRYQRATGQPKSWLPVGVASIGGLLLFGFAIFWRLNAGVAAGDRAADHAVSYISGILGVIAIFFAASMILDRFAGDDN